MTSPPQPGTDAIGALAPEDVLRAGINMSNVLLVTDRDENGGPLGVSPSLAGVLADALGVPVELIPFPGPGEVVDALSAGDFDIGNIGADPSRADQVDFSPPYSEIDSTYLVRGESDITSVDEVDRPGNRIVSKDRSAYTLWLDRHIKEAEIIHTDSTESAFQTFVDDDLDVLAGLRPRLIEDSRRIEGSRVLEGRFSSVQQAIGIHKTRDDAGLDYLNGFVNWAITSGLIADLIERFGVVGLSVAQPAEAPTP